MAKPLVTLPALLLTILFFSSTVLAETISINPAQPLVLPSLFFTETIGGTGTAIVENGVLQSFTLTGTYLKEYNDTYKIGPYSIGTASKKNDLKLSLSEASVTMTPTISTITGAVTVYQRPFHDEETTLIGSPTPTREEIITLSWNGTTLKNTTMSALSESTNAYYSINGSNPKTIRTNTRLFLMKDNVGAYATVYTQEEGTAVLKENTLSTTSTMFTAHFTTATIQNGTLKKNNATTPLATLATPLYNATVTLNGIDITNGQNTITTTKRTTLRTLIDDAKRRGRLLVCGK